MYKSFPKRELISDWNKLLKMSKKEVIALHEQWKLIDEENKETNKKLYEEKTKKIKEASDFMKSIGIDVFKYKKKGFFTQPNGYQTWFKNNVVDIISKKYPYYSSGLPVAHPCKKEVDGIELYCNQSPTTIVELYSKITSQYNLQIKEKNKNNKLFIKSIEYATLHNIDIEDLDTKQVIRVVNEYAKNNYLKENVPSGTEVYLKHGCDECTTYIMGEHRCLCGNRRIDIIVEGDIIDGFYHYPEPY